jgi:hypothetical protein
MQIFRKIKNEKRGGTRKMKGKESIKQKDEENICRPNGKHREKNITQKIK